MTLFPKPKLSKEQIEKFVKDPEVVLLEVLFVFLTLCNVFVLYRILLNVCPFPVFVTWAQLLVSWAFAFLLGEISREFPRCAFFPAFSIDFNLYEGLAAPTLIYLGMITLANVLLHIIPSVAIFPVVVSFAVALHHVCRFFGCGQTYLPVRWLSVAAMFLGFFLTIFDKRSMGIVVFPAALAYGLFSSTFRAWCLEKAMHVVEGQGNVLHNHQVAMGLVVLPFVVLLTGEWRGFGVQSWGCLVTAGTIPFVKNVVANKLIRKTGQAPWRILEILSVILVFLIGGKIVAFGLVLSGRVFGMLDALSKDAEDKRRAILRDEATHGIAMEETNYDPTGITDSFEPTDDDHNEEPTGAGVQENPLLV